MGNNVQQTASAGLADRYHNAAVLVRVGCEVDGARAGLQGAGG